MSKAKKSRDMPKISIRIEHEIKQQLDLLSDLNPEVNRSQIIREAISLWLNANINRLSYRPSELCIISRNLLKIAFDSMSETQMDQMAKRAFLNSQKWKEVNFDTKMDYSEILDLKTKRETLEGYLDTLLEYVYGSAGYKWFTEIKYKKSNHEIQITGKHQLGLHFNTFIKYHLNYHLEHFNYHVHQIKATYKENLDDHETILQISMKKKEKTS